LLPPSKAAASRRTPERCRRSDTDPLRAAIGEFAGGAAADHLRLGKATSEEPRDQRTIMRVRGEECDDRGLECIELREQLRRRN